MVVRLVLPVAAAVALAAVGGCSSERTAQPTQVRPAQMAQSGPCDALVQRVEAGMPTAVAFRVPAAQADLREAQELCDSGQSQEGAAMLRGILGYMHEEP